MKNTKQTLRRDEAEATCITTEISANEFKDFKSFLSIIKGDFNDLCLVDGAFRSYSNNHSIIVETGFRSFREMSFNIYNIRSFLKSISALDKKNNITVTANDNSIVFEDQLGTYQVVPGNADFLDNKFISDGEMLNAWLNNMDPNKLIISGAIPKIGVRRMKIASLKHSSDGIYFKYDKNNIIKGFLSMLLKPSDSGQLYNSGKKEGPSELKIELKAPLIIPLSENHYFKLGILPTLFNKDDIYLKCYITNDQEIFSIFSTKVNDLFVNIYSKSELIEESEEG